MRKKNFGHLKDVQIAEISFGGAALSGEGGGYGFGPIREDEAEALVKEAFERGINLFDSAPIYGFGLSERRIGAALKQVRSQVYLMSKSGVTWHPNKRVNMTNDPETTQKMLEESLKNFQTEMIDFYLIHWPDPRVDIRRPMEVLAKAKREGKIRFIGLCNTNLSDLLLAQEIERIDVIQSEWNFFERASVSPEFLQVMKREQIAFMSWGTFDKGILTGRVTPERKFDPLDARSWAPWWKKADRTFKFKTMEKILPLLQEYGHSPLEFALGFNLRSAESQEFLTTALCGVRNHEQLVGVIEALDHLPSQELLERCERIMK